VALIQVRDLKKIYGDQVVLSDINFDVEDGAVRVLMGPSRHGLPHPLHQN